MGNTTNKKNWAAQERLKRIEQAVWWRGWIKRKDLVEWFGISSAQASSDLQKYQELNPDALVYQMSRKRYEGAKNMRCQLHEPSLEEGLFLFLNPDEMAAVSRGGSRGDRRGEIGLWSLMDVSLPVRKACSEVERAFVLAVAGGLKIRVRYWSLNSGKATWRWLAPHAFGYDGYRWHVRAWCFTREAYLDFVLSRTEKIDWPEPMEGNEQLPPDTDWETVEVVKVRPSSSLDKVAQSAIMMDYGIGENGVLELSVRSAMKQYLLSQLRLVEEGGELPKHFELVGD